ncbi:hypothetical protein [Rosettibacter firmus]|uniref:hypothetical protein n=1 Tax=Rosettibacter firmus TaxID=3111522 RepID=UPI00336C0138
MDFSKIIHFLEQNISSLSNAFYEQVKQSEYMQTYKQFDKNEVIKRAEKVFLHLIDWLKAGSSNIEAEKYFEQIGAERFREGFPLTEVNYALLLQKKYSGALLPGKKTYLKKWIFLKPLNI